MEAVRVERLDHLGLIAHMIKDLGLISMIDARIVPDAQEEITGSSPCLRPAHHIDSKGLISSIDLRRIPHKMLETPASHKEEPDAWILSVSKPGLPYQNSG